MHIPGLYHAILTFFLELWDIQTVRIVGYKKKVPVISEFWLLF